MKVRCEYCHKKVDAVSSVCPGCGLSLPEAPVKPVKTSRVGAKWSIAVTVIVVCLSQVALQSFNLYKVRSKLTQSTTMEREIIQFLEDTKADRESIIHSLEQGNAQKAYSAAKILIESVPSEETGAWCIDTFKEFERTDLAVRCALLSDRATQTNTLFGLVENVPLSELMPESPLRQVMEVMFVQKADKITLKDLQQVNYLSVGGTKIKCGLADADEQEAEQIFSIDIDIKGGDIGMIYFQGLRRLDCTSIPPDDILILGLEELSIPRTYGIKDLSSFAEMQNLTKLTVGGQDFQSLSGIKALPNLKHLGIEGSSLPDLSVLSTQKSVVSLSLVGNAALANLNALADMTQLQELSLAGEAITDLSMIENLTNLQSLSIVGTKINDTAFLSNLKELKTLTFDQNENVSTLPQLASLPHLQVLMLESDELLTEESVHTLTELQQLRLRVTKNLTFLSPLQNLEELTIWTYRITLNVSPLASLPNLRRLSFTSGDHFYDSYTVFLEGIGALKALPLEILDIAGKDFYEPIDAIFEIATLQELNLNQASSNGTNYKKLANLTNLRVLYMEGYRDMLHIPPGPHEEFWRYEAGPASTFADSLGLLANLEKLHLSNCDIEDISFVESLKKLKILDLDSNRITDISPLREMNNLTYLCLTNNRIDDYTPLEGLSNIMVLT